MGCLECSIYDGFVFSCYWFVAIVISSFWGIYGILDEANKDTKIEIVTERQGKVIACTKTQTKYIGKLSNPEKAWGKLGFVYSFGAFLSDFSWSMIGWIALSILSEQYTNSALATFNIFLGIVAVVGITGYGFKIPEKIKLGQ